MVKNYSDRISQTLPFNMTLRLHSFVIYLNRPTMNPPIFLGTILEHVN